MNGEQGISRRHALIGGGAAALAASFAAHGVAVAQKGVQSGGGIAGGGTIDAQDGGEANFSVFGSQFLVDGVAEPILFGSLRWRDANGVTLISTAITAYGPVEGDEQAREMSGVLAMDGEDGYPFTIRMVAGVNLGESSVSLTVLPAGASATATPIISMPVYTADGPLTSGDIQLLTFEFPE
jgi:hypothetical protein